MTKVLFFDIPETKNYNGEILAIFPDIIEKKQAGHIFYSCYAHLGQHSTAQDEFINNKKLASPDQYADLLKELVNQGYDDLKVMNTEETEYRRKPTNGEIKFGHGATHYMTFIRWEIQKGLNWPKWLKTKNDGLRYYY